MLETEGHLDARLGKALSHPLRPRILQVLTLRGQSSPVQVAAELGAPLGQVAYHMRMLRQHGCVELVRTERRRGAIEHYYRPVVAPFLTDEQWQRLPVPIRRQLTADTARRIVGAIAHAVPRGGFDPPGAHVDRMSLRLDADGWRELSDLLTSTLEEAARIQNRSDLRRVPADATPSELAILHFATDGATGRREGEVDGRA